MSSPNVAPDLQVTVDFDWTVSDTSRFSDDLWDRVADHAGADAQEVGETSKEHYADPERGGYDFVSHMSSLELDPGEMWTVLKELLAEEDYDYDDAHPFIDALLDMGIQPRMLSFGERVYQTAKIEPFLGRVAARHDGLVLSLTTVLVEKRDHLAEYFPDAVGVHIDDSPDQKFDPHWTEIYYANPEAPKFSPDVVADFTVSGLMEAVPIIRDLAAQTS